MDIPKRCIWCLKGENETAFADISHVVPECVGNADYQTLPAGIVCKKYNQYFGSKVEPALLRDPIFHVIAVFLRLADPEDMNEFRDHIFDPEHPSIGEVTRKMKLHANITSDTYNVDVEYGIAGRLSKTYEFREIALLSRAVHKIAFESLAWSLFVKGIDKQLDLFASDFNHVRDWSRYGIPVNRIRPVIRKQSFKKVKPGWETNLWEFPDFIGVELNLFGDWYVVSLTSPLEKAEDDLKKRIDPSNQQDHLWIIGETFKSFS